MLPKPSSTFTIPSLHDDTELECRIYHPPQIGLGFETKAITIAHPYTPMGGCFDDHVLDSAGGEFLTRGYIVGLFNLRGAGGSKGHASWNSRPEQDDYISFAGLLLCYLDELECERDRQSDIPATSTSTENSHEDLNSNQPSASQTSLSKSKSKRVLVLGGYSYGSHLVRQILPRVSSLNQTFQQPPTGSAAAEIRLRAAHLARDHVREINCKKEKAEAAKRNSRGRSTAGKITTDGHLSLGAIYGGEESQPGSRRTSRESSRHGASLELVRKTMEKSRARFSRTPSAQSHPQTTDQPQDATLPFHQFSLPEIRYLLISPLLPPLSSLLSLPFSLSSSSTHFWSKTGRENKDEGETQLRDHHSLAIWGTKDGFTSSRRLKKWAEKLQLSDGAEMKESRFAYYEVQDAGHFWLEDGADAELRRGLRAWMDSVDDEDRESGGDVGG